MLHTLLVKRFNDLLDGQKSQRSINKFTYFYVGDHFCIHLGTKHANFQEKIFCNISHVKLGPICASINDCMKRCSLSTSNSLFRIFTVQFHVTIYRLSWQIFADLFWWKLLFCCKQFVKKYVSHLMTNGTFVGIFLQACLV